MGFWSNKIEESKTVLKIENGTLLKCTVKEGNVTIPDNVTAVDENAFKDCKDVRINMSDEYITNQLAFLIKLSMKSTVAEFLEEKKIIKFDESFPSLKVCNMQADQIEKAIKWAFAAFKEKYPDYDWNLTEIDADEINSVCNEIQSIGRENLTKEDGDSISTFKNIPFLFHYPVRELGKESERANRLIAKEGFGFLYIKNLNVENNSTLPHNFMYNLIKGHSFDHVRLSPKWGVILDVGEGVQLDAPGDVGKWFNGNMFRNLTPEKFMKDMERKKSIVNNDSQSVEKKQEPQALKGAFADFFEDSDEEQPQVQNNSQIENNVKEIDWEERHFQICLALISRTDIDTHAQGFPETKAIDPSRIIQQADKMIDALKKHNEEQNQKN